MPRSPHPVEKRRRTVTIACAVATCLAWVTPPVALRAHEIGTTRVVATFADDATYTITVITDAGALLNRLELSRKQPLTTPGSIDEFQRAFDGLCDELPRHLAVVFDGSATVPAATCLLERADAGGLDALGVTVTLHGTTPSRAQTFRWKYDLTFARYALTLKSSDPQRATTMWLEGDEESAPIALAGLDDPAADRAPVWRTYLTLGFTHILPKGLDHILFVLGIFLLSRRLRPMLWQVSAFTLAHSVTLGLTLYGVISLPSNVVEPLIAISIVYVAVENLVTTELKPWRVALVFAFGLLHGMGFAGVLQEVTLARSEFLVGLVAFNAGVEAGQLTVILSALLLVGLWRQRADYRRLIVVPASLAIAVTGLWWTVQRIAL
jgi:hydrogenase/urease accessory protein HupE